jgi:hypothetical protein
MSEVKVDTISERTTDAGVTIEGVKVEDGVATFQTAAGSPLVFEGATADAFETTFAITDPTADRTITFPDSSFTVPTSGGLTQFSQFRLTADFAGDAAPIASSLAEVASPVGFGKLPDEVAGGSNSMAESSGIFTFPSTGYWLITYNVSWNMYTVNVRETHKANIYTTTNNSTYAEAVRADSYVFSGVDGNEYTSVVLSYIFEVTDTANCKCAFYIDIVTGTVTTQGDSALNKTYMTFVKLADI